MRCQGLTLPELMLSLAIMAVLLSLGTPALAELIHNTRARLEAGRLLSAVLLARAESVTRGVPVALCAGGADPAQLAGCDGAFHQGWLVHTDAGGAGFDPGVDRALRAFAPMPAGYRVLNRNGSGLPSSHVLYRPDGSVGRNLTLQVCPPAGLEHRAWSVVLSPAGRPRLARGWGECP